MLCSDGWLAACAHAKEIHSIASGACRLPTKSFSFCRLTALHALLLYNCHLGASHRQLIIISYNGKAKGKEGRAGRRQSIRPASLSSSGPRPQLLILRLVCHVIVTTHLLALHFPAPAFHKTKARCNVACPHQPLVQPLNALQNTTTVPQNRQPLDLTSQLPLYQKKPTHSSCRSQKVSPRVRPATFVSVGSVLVKSACLSSCTMQNSHLPSCSCFSHHRKGWQEPPQRKGRRR